MRVEFFEDGYFDGSPLIVIYGREPEVLAALLTALRSLATREGMEVALHEVPGVQAAGPRVFMTNRRSTWLHPEGVYSLKPEGTFRWCRESEGWLEVADKVESFLEGTSAGQSNIQQHLEESGDASIIMSDKRAW